MGVGVRVGVPRPGVGVIVGVPAVTEIATELTADGSGVSLGVETKISTVASAKPMIEKFPWASTVLSSTERR